MNRFEATRRAVALASLVWASLAAAPDRATADCGAPAANVTCSGLDADGFDAAAVEPVDLVVEAGATVENPAGDVIRLNNDSSATVRGTGLVDGTANNAASIRAGDGATITVEAGGDVTASGLDSSAIVAGDSASVRNDGTITTTQSGATAIQIGSSGIADNFGTIQMTGDGVAGLVGADSNARVVNFGTLDIAGDNAVGIRAGDLNENPGQPTVGNGGSLTVTGANAIGIDVNDGNSAANSGILTIDGADGIGIRANDSNRVSNTQPLTILGANAIGVRLNDSNTFENVVTGSIDATGVDGIGVLLGADGGSGNLLTNDGSITGGSGLGAAISTAPSGLTMFNEIINRASGTIAAGGSGIAIRGGAGIDILRNSGAITGDVLLGGGEDVFRPRIGGSVAGMIDGGAGLDQVVLGGNNAAVFDMGSVSNFESLALERGTWTLHGVGNFSAGALVDGTIAPVLVLDEPATLNGDLSLTDGAILRAIIDPQGTSGHLAVDGSVDVTGNVLLEVIEQNPILTGSTFELLAASGGIGPGVDPFTISTPPDTAVLGFEVLQSAANIELTVTRQRTYESAATTPNQAAVASNLDALLPAGVTGELATLLSQIDMLSSAEAAVAFQSLHPEAYDAHSSTLLSMSSTIVDLVSEGRGRCDRVYEFQLFGQDQRQPNPCGDRGRRVWAQGTAVFANRDAAGNPIDFVTTAGAFVAGSDLEMAGTLVSAFLGATTASLDVKGIGDGEVSTFELGALAERRFGAARIRTVALYGHGWHDQRRAIRIAGVSYSAARGEFQSNRFTSHTELAYGFEFAGIEILPLAQLEYTYASEQAFDESRAAGARLTVEERTTSHLRSAFGARVAYEALQFYWLSRWLAWTDGVWRGELDGRWLKVWAGNDRNVDAHFAGAPVGTPSFRVKGEDVEQAAVFGARVHFQPLLMPAQIGVGYDFQFGDGTTAHRASAELRIPF